MSGPGCVVRGGRVGLFFLVFYFYFCCVFFKHEALCST